MPGSTRSAFVTLVLVLGACSSGDASDASAGDAGAASGRTGDGTAGETAGAGNGAGGNASDDTRDAGPASDGAGAGAGTGGAETDARMDAGTGGSATADAGAAMDGGRAGADAGADTGTRAEFDASACIEPYEGGQAPECEVVALCSTATGYELWLRGQFYIGALWWNALVCDQSFMESRYPESGTGPGFIIAFAITPEALEGLQSGMPIWAYYGTSIEPSGMPGVACGSLDKTGIEPCE